MTSDRIKKALGHCEFDNCSGCPLAGIGECYNIAVKEALNYINQLESEVESITEKFECQQQVYADLSKIIKNQRTEIDGLKTRNINNCRHWQKKYSSLRAEAIKEFAKKLVAEYKTTYYLPNDDDLIMVAKSDMYNLVKEMVGETDDT